MTVLTLKAVGLCAHTSPVGDRAFRYALSLARGYGLKLNIFSFLSSPWDPDDIDSTTVAPEAREKLLVQADQRLREYYDDRCGDFLDVGFRVCEGREDQVLRRCLKRKEYELLVIPYLERGGRFGDLTIEEFANRFLAPVVLVGRWRKVRYYLNAQAVHIADRLHLYRGTWRPLHHVSSNCPI